MGEFNAISPGGVAGNETGFGSARMAGAGRVRTALP